MTRIRWSAVLLAGSLFAAESREFTAQQKRWWAIQPLAPSAPPVSARTRIDAFLNAKLAGKSIAANAPADRATLLRRVTLDLTGLVPTLEETQAFLSDRRPDAWERVVDRLLASPRYGERWARHWLDLARYADSEGFKADETRPNVWRYRDYVIRSFNSDKPYDRFVQEQLAGDEMFPGDPDALVATAFNRHFPDESNARNLFQRRQELLNDITDTVGSTFMGLTFGCARCHDHKFDPILHADYYRLQAFFAGLRIEDQAALVKPEVRRDYEVKRMAWESQTRGIREAMNALIEPVRKAKALDNFEKFPQEIQDAVNLSPEKRNGIQWQMYYKAKPYLYFPEAELARALKGEAKARYAELKEELAKFDPIKPADLPIGQVMVESHETQPPVTHILRGGAWDAPEKEVAPGFLTILDPAPAKIAPAADGLKTGRRTALARWLTEPKNPLTARVMVNRVWHYHFGRGIVATPSDFGTMGERPTHRELLDDLASRFIAGGWSVKKLHREILLSDAYQRSSDTNEKAAQADPDNKLLWRFPRRRLEGEAIRDAMLQVSGLLSTKMYGPGVFPPMPEGVVTRGGWKAKEDAEEANRRSVYVFVRRNTRYPMFEAFDMPDTHESCARRNQTVTPSQALELMNNQLVFDWSRAFAQRVANDAGLSASTLMERVYRMAYSRPPSPDEIRAGEEFLARQRRILAGQPDAEEKALTDLCHAIFNTNEFLHLN